MTTIKIKITPEMIPNDLEGIVIEIDGNGTANTKRPTAERNPRVFAYMYGLARRLERDGRHGTADNYRCATAALRKFCRGNTSIRFSQLDTALMARFEDALRRQGLKRTTVSFYMSTLKAMYNKAVRDGATTDREPFKNSCTTVGTTPKRAIPLRQIRQISRMYVRTRQMALARDMFMFSLYTRGMPFVDMTYLKKSDLRNGVLTYRRKKTGQPLAVKWEQCMQDIVDSYPTGDSSFLLPIISDPTADLRRQYKNRQRYINSQLAKIGARLHLSTKLTMYVARHSWASLAKDMGVPIGVISEALGHTSVKTTKIYLKAIDPAVIDRANHMLLANMNSCY